MKFSDQNCFNLFPIPSAHTSPYMEMSGKFRFENYDLCILRRLLILSIHASFFVLFCFVCAFYLTLLVKELPGIFQLKIVRLDCSILSVSVKKGFLVEQLLPIAQPPLQISQPSSLFSVFTTRTSSSFPNTLCGPVSLSDFSVQGYVVVLFWLVFGTVKGNFCLPGFGCQHT